MIPVIFTYNFHILNVTITIELRDGDMERNGLCQVYFSPRHTRPEWIPMDWFGRKWLCAQMHSNPTTTPDHGIDDDDDETSSDC